MNKKQALEILNEVINNYIDIFRSDKKEIKEIEKALKILNQQASERASREDNMADRTIYRLTEYNLNNELIKTVYHNHRERAEEEKNNNENESQYIEELSFDANDMNDLCNRLNSDVIED